MDDFTRSLIPTSPAENDMAEYSPPVICLILTILAGVELVAGCIIAVLIAQTLPDFRWYAAGVVGLAVLKAIMSLAVAEFLNLTGKTEFHARKLHAIEKHLARIVPG
jgi:hypothetical protein